MRPSLRDNSTISGRRKVEKAGESTQVLTVEVRGEVKLRQVSSHTDTWSLTGLFHPLQSLGFSHHYGIERYPDHTRNTHHLLWK
jgi:hypothetical protein